jgi:hypothetical protein
MHAHIYTRMHTRTQLGSNMLVQGGVGAPAGSAYLLQSNGTKNSWLDVSSIVKSANLEQLHDGVRVAVPPLVIMYGWEDVNVTTIVGNVTNGTDWNGTDANVTNVTMKLVRLARFVHTLCMCVCNYVCT